MNMEQFPRPLVVVYYKLDFTGVRKKETSYWRNRYLQLTYLSYLYFLFLYTRFMKLSFLSLTFQLLLILGKSALAQAIFVSSDQFFHCVVCCLLYLYTLLKPFS